MVLKQHTITEFGKQKAFDESVTAFLASGKKITQMNHWIVGEGSNVQFYAFIVYEE